MRENKSRFVQVTQQAFALAVVAAVAVSATGVIELEIVSPSGDAATPGVTAAPPLSGVRSTPASLVSAEPVRTTVRTVPLGGTTSGRSSLRHQSGKGSAAPQPIRVVSPAEKTSGFAVVGVTWDEGADLAEDGFVVSVRTRDHGTWSAWQEMHHDADHAPDHGSTEDRVVRDGTDAVVVGRVDDVQVKAVSSSGQTPADLALALVDPGEDVAPTLQEPALGTPAGSTGATTSTSSTTSGTGSPDAVLAAAGMPVAPEPEIFSRKQWGADERLRDAGSLRYGDIQAGFVHHTVNANDYSRDDVPSILRGIYAYHTQSRGWSDVGYNFLVDRFGRIWEGRYGGVARAVVGAHTLGYNEHSFAMSAIGNFETARPSEEMVDAYAALFAWKLSLSGIRADDTRQVVAGDTFQAINGHRDAGQTACPGTYLYARIPDIRRKAAAIQDGAVAPTPTGPGAPLQGNLSGAAWPDLIVRDATTHHALIVRTGGQTAYLEGVTAATSWRSKDLLVAPGDLDGDGAGDIIARSATSGVSRLFRGTGAGSLGSTTVYKRFTAIDQLTGVGDLDGDGANDVVGRRTTDDALVLFRGNGAGTFLRPITLAPDWSGYDTTAGVDDFDGDGHADLVARSGDTLFLVPGTGRARIGTPRALPGSWGHYDLVAGRGDATGDGLADLVVRSARTGATYLYPGDGAGGVQARIGGWTRFSGLRWLGLGGQLDGTGRPDLVGVTGSTGRLRVFADSGRRNLGRTVDTGVVLDDVDLVLNVGDWNADGRGDVMTRTTSGRLQFRAGRKGNRLAPPVRVARNWGNVTMVAPVGDVDGDGYADLVGRDGRGRQRVYPGNGSTGFKATYATGAVAGVEQAGLGDVGADGTPDTAVRRADGSLWLRPLGGGAETLLANGLRRYDWVRGLGDVDGDGTADLVVRTRATGNLWLLPGRKSGIGQRRLIGAGFGGYDLG